MAIMTTFSSIIIMILTKLFGEEIVAWLPALSNWLLEQAISRLPIEARLRYSEEWESHLAEIPGKISKVLCAMGLLFAARGIHKIISPARELPIETPSGLVQEISASSLGLLPEPESRPVAFIISWGINITILGTILMYGMMNSSQNYREKHSVQPILARQITPLEITRAFVSEE